jgi:preprotein translocase subunit YajC
LFNLITFAFAQTNAPGAPGGQSQGSGLTMLIPILLMIVVFYFILIRPSQKKEKERKKMIDAIKKGDKVITVGGMYGVVTNVKSEENIIELKIADKTKVEFSRTSIQNKVS